VREYGKTDKAAENPPALRSFIQTINPRAARRRVFFFVKIVAPDAKHAPVGAAEAAGVEAVASLVAGQFGC
jgi:hypothetical protein